MTFLRFAPVVLIAMAGNVLALEHVGNAPATHMEIKDDADNIVCLAYSTPPDSAPVADDCPAGTYTEQLFDAAWNQIGQTMVTISDAPPMARTPMRVERVCEWNEFDLFDTFRSADAGSNFDPYCDITCPTGVAIDGEATGTIPGLVGTDDATTDQISHTDGTGLETIRIFVRSGVPAAVVFERFTLNGEPADFSNLIYEVNAAAVCL